MTPYFEGNGVTIYHADVFQLLPVLNQDDFSVMVTDPPYGIAHASNHGSGNKERNHLIPWFNSEIRNDKNTNARDNVLRWFGERPALVFGSWKQSFPDGAKTALIWSKGGASGMGDLSIPWKESWEMIFVLGSGFRGYRSEGVLCGHWVPSRITGTNRSHPHEKPVSLLRLLIEKCPPGTVFDPFCGTGTTLRAAADLGRRAVGIEIEERYCERAAERMLQIPMLIGQEDAS